ncbi:MAG: diguanylate cyclase [Moraxellaceae bacterium]|jgi:diguanylate cyclase (GGDEF)-like protein|nr:diguanylate cyclase [Moraxellaceae bacterium]
MDSKPANAPADFSWFSNPLDWRTIDRLILLGSLVMLAPGLFGLALVAAFYITPDYLYFGLARPLLVLYGLHVLLLGGFLYAALRRRQHSDDWPVFENFIIASFLFTVLVTAWLTGTHFAEGLLLIFLGINITSALANIQKIRKAYLWGCAVMALFAVIDFSGALPAAPLLAKPMVGPDGQLVLGWLVIRVVLAAILLAISAISMAAINRWVERENLYREMSTIDGLTRLTNRRSFIERGHSELSRAQRTGSGSVACVMVDLDHFKKINDTWGHHAGDAVLVAASAIMMSSARQYDEVGRYGGEEFALLLPGTTLESAVCVAERIRERIATTPVAVDGKTIPMTASFGVALYPAPGIETLNDLLKAADKALYEAKEAGRNCVCTARPDAA